MNIVFIILAFIMVFGMIGCKGKTEHINYTLGFIACVVGATLTTIF